MEPPVSPAAPTSKTFIRDIASEYLGYEFHGVIKVVARETKDGGDRVFSRGLGISRRYKRDGVGAFHPRMRPTHRNSSTVSDSGSGGGC